MSRLYLLLFIIICSSFAEAQEGFAINGSYISDNMAVLHPSAVGAATELKARLTSGRQWADLQDAPTVTALTVSYNNNRRLGIGASIFTDENGNHTQQGIALMGAYHNSLSTREQLILQRVSFGFGVQLTNNRLDGRNLAVSNLEDDNLSGQVDNDLSGNTDISAAYYYQNFYAFLTFKNLSLLSRQGETSSDFLNLRRLILNVGNTYGYYDVFTYEPSIMLQHVFATAESFLDINFKVLRPLKIGSVWGSSHMRLPLDFKSSYLGAVFGANINKYMISYTYTQQFGGSVIAGDFHLVTIGVSLLREVKEYECNCPFVNIR